MPEAPEIQALTERIEAAFQHQELARLDIHGFAGLKTVAPAPADLHGKPLVSMGRRGKYLIFDFLDLRVAMHLSQGGRVDIELPAKVTRPKGAVARLKFEAGSLLLKEFGTERKAALWVLSADDEGPMAVLGPETDDPAFEELLRNSTDRRRLHTFLRDQRTIAGIGRGFTDDILHRAKLSPFATMAGLDADERSRLISVTHEVLREGLESERKRTGGLPPKLGDRFKVHNQTGRACPECGTKFLRVSYESHEITYCPECQTQGKVLADRRLSRLLR